MRAAVGGGDGGEDFARETGAAAYVEDVGGGGEGEEGEGAVGHFDLDGLDAGGGGVFAGFGVVVEEVGGTGMGGGGLVLGVVWEEGDGGWRGGGCTGGLLGETFW